MIAAQKRVQLGDNGLPYPRVVKDNRDRLYNDGIRLMQEMGVRWTDPQRYGVPFLENLSNALWYIDGHHSTIGEKAPKVPEIFSRFTGYNCPEKHKHRKRTMDNLSRSEILAHSLALQDSLQSSWFKKEAYKELKKVTTELMSSLNLYAAYLQEKNKVQKIHHAMNCPTATPNESSHTEYIPKITVAIPSALKPIDEVLQNKESYEPIAVMDYAPGNRKQRYRYL